MIAADFQLVAQRIHAIADFGKGLKSLGVSDRAIVALLAETTGLPKRDIKLVLEGLRGLHNWVGINGGHK